MAFLSRSGQQEEFGSGGKILHSRRYLPRLSPYSRPSSSASPLALLEPESETGGSPGWFRGLICGAGKLISSVIGSEESGSPSECSSDYSSDKEHDSLTDEHGGHLLSDDLAGFDKRENVVDGNVESLAIVSKSESKLVIEQLLQQETFTRDECSKLMEILRSRVLDIPSAKGGEVIQEEVPKRVSEKSPWQSLNQNWNISGSSNISPSNLSALSPRYYFSKEVTPDLRNRAVMEAKKWFEEKKLSPSSVGDKEFGACVLNTDMNQYCFDSQSGSPIEMAKSYMQSLPPWRSSSSTSGFKNLPSSGKHTSCSSGSHLLLSSKVKRRDYSATGTLQYAGDFLKSVADEQGRSKLKQAKSATSPFFEVSRTPPATTNFGNKVQDEPLRSHDRDSAKIGHPLDMHMEISEGSIVEFQGLYKETQEMPKIASENFIEQLHSDLNSSLPYDSDMFMSDKNQIKDVGMPSIIEVQIDSISAPHDSLLMFSMSGRKDGTETETFQPESVIPAMQRGVPTTTDSSIAANASQPSHQHPGDVSSKIPSTQIISSSTNKPLNSAKMKSVERVHTETMQSGRGKRRAKKVVRQKRRKSGGNDM